MTSPLILLKFSVGRRLCAHHPQALGCLPFSRGPPPISPPFFSSLPPGSRPPEFVWPSPAAQPGSQDHVPQLSEEGRGGGVPMSPPTSSHPSPWLSLRSTRQLPDPTIWCLGTRRLPLPEAQVQGQMGLRFSFLHCVPWWGDQPEGPCKFSFSAAETGTVPLGARSLSPSHGRRDLMFAMGLAPDRGPFPVPSQLGKARRPRGRWAVGGRDPFHPPVAGGAPPALVTLGHSRVARGRHLGTGHLGEHSHQPPVTTLGRQIHLHLNPLESCLGNAPVNQHR